MQNIYLKKKINKTIKILFVLISNEGNVTINSYDTRKELT